jgi:hypothetical protein
MKFRDLGDRLQSESCLYVAFVGGIKAFPLKNLGCGSDQLCGTRGEGTNFAWLSTPGETKALAKSKVHQ